MCSCHLYGTKLAGVGAEGRGVYVYQMLVTVPACYVSREKRQEVSLRGARHAFDSGGVFERLWCGLGLRSGPELARGGAGAAGGVGGGSLGRSVVS